jgi:hypothetical protein
MFIQIQTLGFTLSGGLPLSGSQLKKVFSSDIGVEPSSQVLDIPEYACGLILDLALISNENPNFEMAFSVLILN